MKAWILSLTNANTIHKNTKDQQMSAFPLQPLRWFCMCWLITSYKKTIEKMHMISHMLDFLFCVLNIYLKKTHAKSILAFDGTTLATRGQHSGPWSHSTPLPSLSECRPWLWARHPSDVQCEKKQMHAHTLSAHVHILAKINQTVSNATQPNLN